ncbi:MAG: hypothetical protein M3179_03785, partial [Actinomycetota bacterium]|nr:hypothetical protein [Actinomycetota bacterium]
MTLAVRLGALTVTLAVIASLAVTPPAGAQSVLAPSPTFPSTVTVGETFDARLTLAHGLTPPSPAASPVVTVDQVELIPACHTAPVGCLAGTDPGVFSLAAAGVATAGPPTCTGTWRITEITPGVFSFVAPGGEGSLRLGPAEACVVEFTATVRRGVPIDANPLIPEMQTGQLASATLTAPELGTVRHTGASETTVLRAPTRMTTHATPTGVVGQPIVDVATVEGGVDPTGTVTFFTFGPNDPTCTGFPKAISILNPLMAGSPPAATSAPFTPTVPGTYTWIASYSGDLSNQGALSVCGEAGESSVVLPTSIAPSLTLSAPSEAIVGQPITAAATLAGGINPAGVLTFALHGPIDATCIAPPVFTATVLVLGNGTYSAGLFVPALPGTYRWTATYGGDLVNRPATTGCGAPGASTLVALPTPTTTTTTTLPPTTTTTSTT